jgi:hypothetical protein
VIPVSVSVLVVVIVCLQIITELRKGFKVLKVERIGEDRGTIYRIQVVE